MPALKFQQFNPIDITRKLLGANGAWVADSRSTIAAASPASLIELNIGWYKQPMAMQQTVGWLWAVNTRLTELGIAPAWRGAPPRVKVAPAPLAPARSTERAIGDTAMRNQVRRWVDLQWLRAVLGPQHRTLHAKWQGAFSKDMAEAEETWGQINALRSSGAGLSNMTAATETPHKVLFSLAVPKHVALGLGGLINREAGALLVNARRRVATKARPALEELMDRPSRPLSREDVDRRLVFCTALELAPGSPSNAAQLFEWMTGEKISKQSMQAMRDKIAGECGFNTRAWKRVRRRTVAEGKFT